MVLPMTRRLETGTQFRKRPSTVARARHRLDRPGDARLGGEKDEELRFSDGAAYNPATGAWRVLADSPLTWDQHSAATWTGTEWWVVSERHGVAEVAVYEPISDSWRSLPSIPDEYADAPSIAWTGDEIAFTAAGLFSMADGTSEWVAGSQPADSHAPAVWTDDGYVLMASSTIGDDPLGTDYLVYPVGWTPTRVRHQRFLCRRRMFSNPLSPAVTWRSFSRVSPLTSFRRTGSGCA